MEYYAKGCWGLSSNKKKSKDIGNVLAFILCVSIGGFFGYAGADIIGDNMALSDNWGIKLILLGIILFSFYIALYVQIIIHEGGHYLFGKLTGYKLSSFRIGSIMFIKEHGKIKRKKFTIVGTGGQCLMSPPDYEEESYPYALYNLGGSLANIIIALLCYVLYTVLPMIPIVSAFIYVIFILGILFAVINGIPMKVGGIANDGYNILAMQKDKESRKAFWIQLQVNGLQASGTRLSEMPKEWFVWPDDSSLNDPLISGIAVFSCNYYHDKHNFEKARELSEYLLKNAPNMLEVYKNELRCEILFYELIGQCRQEVIDNLYTKQLKKYIKATSSYISRKRLMYAYEVLVTKNEEEINKRLADFNMVAKTYPYKVEVEGEREILDIIDNISLERI